MRGEEISFLCKRERSFSYFSFEFIRFFLKTIATGIVLVRMWFYHVRTVWRNNFCHEYYFVFVTVQIVLARGWVFRKISYNYT